ncbi:hypothetical protein CLAIMM_11096 [Cladophialophora immunda]|nr:hypothetical protein CLAIMM_11096 [Cladophialophora immunda]
MQQRSVDDPSDFGNNYAILNLDLMALLVEAIQDTLEGKAFISNCARWNDAVHAKESRPLTIFTSMFLSTASQFELQKKSPFAKLIKEFDPFLKGAPAVAVDSRFQKDEKDIMLQKIRWYGGCGNALERILQSQNIDTVIISGMSISACVISTIYHLYDLDYNIYVISDNVTEVPVSYNEEYKNYLQSFASKSYINVISLETALQMLEQS